MPFEDIHGNGGLLTTVGDLLKWNENFASPQISDAAFVAEQQQPGRFNDGRTHDYARHGTTTLFAALNVATGEVLRRFLHRHRHQEYLRFLNDIDARVPPELSVHLVVDNYATHKHPTIKRWLLRHPRFALHFTPTSASWLNQVERFFAEITRRRIRRGTFTSVASLERAISEYPSIHNAHPKPFVWTATVDTIFEKIIHHCSVNS